MMDESGIDWVLTGRRLRCFRKSKKLSQDKVAQLLHYTQQMISIYEKGTQDIPTAVLYKLSRLYNVKIDDLIVPLIDPLGDSLIKADNY